MNPLAESLYLASCLLGSVYVVARLMAAVARRGAPHRGCADLVAGPTPPPRAGDRVLFSRIEELSR